MYILHRKSSDPTFHAYLKYDGWHIFRDTPLDLNGCILFTKGETVLNPPKVDEEYQHWGCYPALTKERRT